MIKKAGVTLPFYVAVSKRIYTTRASLMEE